MVKLGEVQPESKQVMLCRSFGARVDNIDRLQEAISYHCDMTGESVRKKVCMCK